MECYEKSRKRQALLPLQSQKGFQLLSCACPRSSRPATRAGTASPGRPFSTSPVRSRSLSPLRQRGGYGTASREPGAAQDVNKLPSVRASATGLTPRVTPKATSVTSPSPAPALRGALGAKSTNITPAIPVTDQVKLKMYSVAKGGAEGEGATEETAQKSLSPRPIINNTSQTKLAMMASSGSAIAKSADDLGRKIAPVKITNIELDPNEASTVVVNPKDGDSKSNKTVNSKSAKKENTKTSKIDKDANTSKIGNTDNHDATDACKSSKMDRGN